MFKSFIKKLNKALRDDSGASLLELIIAVTILAIVTAPLLNTFIVSAKLNAKAKTMGLETNAITSIYEKIKGTDASDIVTANSDGKLSLNQRKKLISIFGAENVAFESDAEIAPASEDRYKQACRSVNLNITNFYSGNDPAKDRKFDANVVMTAIPTGSDGLINISEYTDGYINQDNDTPRAVQMSFDNVWVQPTDSTDPDEIINNYLPKKINKDGTISEDPIDKDPDEKGQKLVINQREITLKLETSTGSDGGSISVTPIITYQYDVEWLEYDANNKKLVNKKIYADSGSDSKPSDSITTAIYTKRLSSFTYKEAGKSDDEHHLFDVILFYKPYYNSFASYSGYKDTITIDNESNLQGDVFIVKESQDDSKEYSGLIKLIENHATADDPFELKVHTNMGLAKTDDLVNDRRALAGGPFQMQKIYRPPSVYNKFVSLNDTKCSVTSLIKEEKIDHIYKYTIKLYKAGELGGKPVCTFNGIKVN